MKHHEVQNINEFVQRIDTTSDELPSGLSLMDEDNNAEELVIAEISDANE